MMLKTILQLLHLFLLAAIPVSYAAMQILFGGEDSVVIMLGIAISLTGVTWSGFVLVYSIVKGDRESVFRDLWNSYRALLCSTPFLIVSVVVFLSIESFLVANTVYYRPVDIWTEEDVILYLNDDIGKQTIIGKVIGGQTNKIRLKVGTRYLSYQALKSGSIGALPPINIPNWFSEKEIEEIRINKEEYYELLQ